MFSVALRSSMVVNAGTADDYTLINGEITGDAVAEFMVEASALVTLKAADFGL